MAAASISSASLLAEPTGGSVVYHNQRYGFSLRVPGDIFESGESRNPEAGALWISQDRQARLIASAQRNTTSESIQSYRKFLLQESYPGASLDYAPVRETWFVLSGIKGRQMFYERITFACDGRYIYGWQLMYPIEQRDLYDEIVREIHRSYRPGQGEDGNCG